jgi:hypothetical protein
MTAPPHSAGGIEHARAMPIPQPEIPGLFDHSACFDGPEYLWRDGGSQRPYGERALYRPISEFLYRANPACSESGCGHAPGLTSISMQTHKSKPPRRLQASWFFVHTCYLRGPIPSAGSRGLYRSKLFSLPHRFCRCPSLAEASTGQQ